MDSKQVVITASDVLENNIIFINSKDALVNGLYLNNDEDRSSFGLYLKKKLSSEADELFKIIVQSCQIPFTFSLTNSNNNYIDWKENAILKTPIQLTEGNYNILEMMLEIETQMNAASSFSATNYTISYNGITNKLLIESASALDTILLFSTGTNVLKSISTQIGFTSDNDITINSTTSGTSDTVINLVTISSLFIRSNLSSLSTIDSLTTTNSDILINLPITVNPLEMISYQYTEGYEYNLIEDNSIEYLTLSLTDSAGTAIDLKKNINWEIVLNIQIIKNPILKRKEININLAEQIEAPSSFDEPKEENVLNELVDEDELIKETDKILLEKHHQETIDKYKEAIKN